MTMHRFWVVFGWWSPLVFVATLLVAMLLLVARASAQPGTTVERFALVVGANDGGPERVTLLYADDDASAFADVMVEMGGLPPDQVVVLLDPSRGELRAAFDELGDRLHTTPANAERREVFFYYSGHSDEQGLLLRDGPVDYRDLRGAVDALGADVQIAILDSCASGHFTRIKGGEHRLPFLYDESSDVRGHAFLTSSSFDEVAQESDAIGASYFTHALVSGLRGAADVSGDGRVTLNEAYRFAFDETLSRTVAAEGGAQHPAYDIGLVGRGDVVLTDLSVVSATLLLEESLQGRLYVRDDADVLVAELFKPAGRRVELGLKPGTYRVVVETDEGIYASSVELVDGGTTVIRPEHLVAQRLAGTTARGGPALIVEERDPADAVIMEERVALQERPTHYRTLFANAAFVSPLDTNRVEQEEPVLNHLGFALLHGSSDRVEGLQISGFGNHVGDDLEGVQLGGGLNIVREDADAVQVSVGVNTVGGRLEGVQIAGGVNIVTGEMVGVQMAGGTSIVTGPIDGVQMAGGVNWANDIEGVQMAPINLGHDVSGLQLGTVNVAGGRVEGLQFGVINYAEEADASIGVIAGTRGGFHPEVWISDTMMPFGALRTEARTTYAQFGVGSYGLGSEADAMLLGFGLGAKLARSGPLGLDLDLSHYWVSYAPMFSFSDYVGLSQLRLLARWQAAPGFALMAGPTFNVFVATDSAIDREPPGFISPVSTYRHDDSTAVALWPGLVLGLSFF